MVNICFLAKNNEKLLTIVIINHSFDTRFYDKLLYFDWLIHPKKLSAHPLSI